jgi:hypothetical protein
VFGTACPPRGLSGALRDVGYRMSEGRIGRWLTLLLADRVNIVEDLAADLTQDRVPNFAKEMGLKSELKYNRGGFAKKALFAGICAAALVTYLARRRR